MSVTIDDFLQILCTEAETGLEGSAVRLWSYYFNNVVFNDPKWAVSSRQPLVKPTGGRVDIIVEGFGICSHEPISTLLFLNAQKRSATDLEVKAEESEAYKKAMDYLTYYKLDSVYAMTCFGNLYRIWVLFPGDGCMTGLYPRDDGLGDKKQYLDLSTSRQELEEVFKFIREHPVLARDNVDSFSTSLGKYNTQDTNAEEGATE